MKLSPLLMMLMLMLMLMLFPVIVLAGADQEKSSGHRTRILRSKVSVDIVYPACRVANSIKLERSSGISRHNCSS
jgi:hypothetical protein